MKESTSGMRPRHYNSQQLLAYLDGEVPGHTAKLMAEHLSCCWSCRASMDDLERDVHQLARLFATPSVQDVWAAQQAKSHFQAWCTGIHSKNNPVLKKTAPDFRRYWLAAAAGFCLLVLCFGSWQNHSVRLTDQEVLAKSLEFEQPIRRSEGIVQQRYTLAIQQDRPQVRYDRSELVVWAQPTEGRYASRWSNGAGQLQYAVWRPEHDGPLWRRSLGSKAIREQSDAGQAPLALADLADGNTSLENIEARLSDWLRRRQCEPVSLAGEFSVFVNNPRTNVSVEEARGGEHIVSLTAERWTSRCKVTMVLRADIKTGQPLSESLRFSTADSAYRIDFLPQNSRLLQPGSEAAAVFQPDASPMEGARISRKQAMEVKPAATTLIPEGNLVDAEIAARYVLHQGEICLGQPVSIWRDKEAGVIRIEGLVENATRRNELKAALAALSHAKLLAIDLQLADEMVHSQPLRRTTAPDTSGPQRTSMLVSEYIDGLTASDQEKQTLKNEAIKLADYYVSSGEALVREVAAFQSLTSAGLESAPLSKKAAHLLGAMRQDHLRSMDQQLSALAESVGDTLRLPALSGSPLEQNQRSYESQTLGAASRAAMMQAQRLQDALLDLFSIGQFKAAGSKESASALAESVKALRSTITQLQAGMLSDTGRDGMADARIPREGDQ